MLLIDYSQVCIAHIMEFRNDITKTGSSPEAANIIRHAILTGIKSYRKKFKDYGELVLCCDGNKYWRKQQFPYYKGQRKSAREESNLNWELIFTMMSELKDDIKEYFPYKILHVDEAEADDIIGTLAWYTQDHALIETPMFSERQNVMIVSADHDFKQLQKYNNVRQWSPNQKTFVRSDNPQRDLIEKILTGDSGDGIPNICSPDNVFMVEGIRQTPFYKKRINDFVANGNLACANLVERHGWDRNKLLIDLDNTPEYIKNKIIHQYENYVAKGDKMSVYNYLVSKRCRLLMENVDEF